MQALIKKVFGKRALQGQKSRVTAKEPCKDPYKGERALQWQKSPTTAKKPYNGKRALQRHRFSSRTGQRYQPLLTVASQRLTGSRRPRQARHLAPYPRARSGGHLSFLVFFSVLFLVCVWLCVRVCIGACLRMCMHVGILRRARLQQRGRKVFVAASLPKP